MKYRFKVREFQGIYLIDDLKKKESIGFRFSRREADFIALCYNKEEALKKRSEELLNEKESQTKATQ